jgi:peptidyl-tRNA hydrolase
VLEAGTATCVGIGPDAAARIDPITGELPLVR